MGVGETLSSKLWSIAGKATYGDRVGPVTAVLVLCAPISASGL